MDPAFILDLNSRHRKHLLPAKYPCIGIRLTEVNGYELFLSIQADNENISRGDLVKILQDMPKCFLEICNEREGFQTFKRNLMSMERLRKGIKVVSAETGMVLDCVDTLVDRMPLNRVRVFPLLCKYGQKEQESIELDKLVLMAAEGVRVLLHPAITIKARDNEEQRMSNVSLLWSRAGLRDIIGSRGTLYSVLSLAGACNYQSNLDGRPLTVSPNLKRVFSTMESQVVFIQFYADTPHVKVSHLAQHPVTGTLSSCGLLHKDVSPLAYFYYQVSPLHFLSISLHR
jgi:hypothetical protein